MMERAEMLVLAGNMPAFPCEAQGDRAVPPEHDYLQTGVYSSKFPGMTLRDWFAGQALSTMIHMSTNGDGGWTEDAVAVGCYIVADAMIRARTTMPDPAP